MQLKPDLERKFQQIYKDNKEKLVNYVARRVSTREDAEDITSEVLLRVYKNLPDFKWQGVSIESWIYKIARNAIIDYHRKYGKERRNLDIDKAENQLGGEGDLLLNLLDSEEQAKLYLAISKLQDTDQYLIYYKYFEELSLTEIASRMELTETNVGTRLHRLRKKLLALMEK